MINLINLAESYCIMHKLKNEILYLLHIPKTAGTSFIALLDNYFDLDSIYSEQVYQRLKKSEDFSKYSFIRGHFGYGIHQMLPKKTVYITMLREPIERTISFFDHMRLEPLRNNWVSKNFLDSIKDISDIFRDAQKTRSFTNNQTRYISVDLKISKILQLQNPSTFRIEEFEDFINPDISDSNLLATAKKRLVEFPFFGIQEKFEESLMMLYYTFGFRPLNNIRKLMVSSKRTRKDTILQQTLKEITECTVLDRDLYLFAQDLFEKKYNQMIDDLKKRYCEFGLSNLNSKQLIYELLERHYEENFDNESYPKTNNVNYNFSQKLFGSGWYYRENTFEKSNHFFRWTGPKKISTIDLPLKQENDLQIQFRVIGQGSQQVLDSLTLMANNVLINLKKVVSTEKNPIFEGVRPTIFEGVLSKSALQKRPKFTRLTFQVAKTESHMTQSFVYPNEKRDVGMAVDYIKISPLPYY